MKFRTRPALTTLLAAAVASLALPGAAWAAEGAGEKWGIWLEAGRLLNLLLVVALLVWVARKPLANFFASRSQAIRDQLAEAQKARLDAERRVAEINAHMSSLEDELAEIKATAERDAREEYQRLLADAERDAQKIVERARREIDGMTRAAQLELKEHTAALSVELAKEKIRNELTDDDRKRLFSRFVAKLGGRQ